MLDELRLSKIARSPAAIAVDALAQGSESKLVAYGADEKQSGFGFGYFGVIVQSVTVDAWVVITILLGMALVSWIVMWTKARYVGAVDKANQYFVQRFREVAGRHLVGLAHVDEAAPTAAGCTSRRCTGCTRPACMKSTAASTTTAAR